MLYCSWHVLAIHEVLLILCAVWLLRKEKCGGSEEEFSTCWLPNFAFRLAELSSVRFCFSSFEATRMWVRCLRYFFFAFLVFSWQPNWEFCVGMLYCLLRVVEIYVKLLILDMFAFLWGLWIGFRYCLVDVKLEENENKVKIVDVICCASCFCLWYMYI